MERIWIERFGDGLWMYFAAFIVTGMFFVKGYILKPIISSFGVKVELFYQKNRRKVDLCVMLFVLAIVAEYCINETIPLLQDYKLMQDGYCEMIVGTVIDASDQDKRAETTRVIFLGDPDGTGRLRITVRSTLIEEGDVVKIYYLPHSGIGEVAEIIDAPVLEE